LSSSPRRLTMMRIGDAPARIRRFRAPGGGWARNRGCRNCVLLAQGGSEVAIRLLQRLCRLVEVCAHAFEASDRLRRAVVELLVRVAERDGRLVGDITTGHQTVDQTLQLRQPRGDLLLTGTEPG